MKCGNPAQQKVPESMFETLFGIHYLRAKGHHYLSMTKLLWR